jgi:hypothetical protein
LRLSSDKSKKQETACLVGWSEIKICKNQQELWSTNLRTLIRNNFYSTTFQNFECGWPCLGLIDRKNGQKTQKKSVFWKKNSKVEVQKLNICACLSRLIKLDEKKILQIYCGGKFDQDTRSKTTTFGQRKVSPKTDTQHSNDHISSS